MSIDSTSVLPGVGGWLLRRRTARPPALVSTSSKPVVPCSSLLVALLDAELADVVGAAVVGLRPLRPVLDRLLLGLVDAPDVAEHVAADLAQRIVAEQPRLDLDAGEAEALGGEARHLLVGELGADRQRVEALAFVLQPLEAAPVARRDLDQLGQLVDRRLQSRRSLRRRDLQRVGRVVVGQHDAVAVDDQAAVGHDRHAPRCGWPRPASPGRRGAAPAGRPGARPAGRSRPARTAAAASSRARKWSSSRSMFFSSVMARCAQWSVTTVDSVRIGRAALRRQQQQRDHRPQQRLEQRREQHATSRETCRRRPGARAATPLRDQEQRQHLQRLRRQAEPQQAAVQRDGGERSAAV